MYSHGDVFYTVLLDGSGNNYISIKTTINKDKCNIYNTVCHLSLMIATFEESGSRNASNLIGGEACMWTEYVDDSILMPRLW